MVINIKVGVRREIPQVKCPQCGTPFSGVCSVGDKEYILREGAFVMCVECCYIMTLNHNLEPRRLNERQKLEVIKRIVR